MLEAPSRGGEAETPNSGRAAPGRDGDASVKLRAEMKTPALVCDDGDDRRVSAFARVVRGRVGAACVAEAATWRARCEWCGAEPEPGTALVECQCKLAAFCDDRCAALAFTGGVGARGRWRPPHKRVCSTAEARVDATLERLSGRLSLLPRDAVTAALALAGERVPAAAAVLDLLLGGGGDVPAGTTDGDVLRTMARLFGSACGPDALRRVEAGLEPDVRAALRGRRDAHLRETAAMRARTARAVAACDAIYADLRGVLGGCMVVRYRPKRPDQPPPVHRTNRDLLDWVHAQIARPDAGTAREDRPSLDRVGTRRRYVLPYGRGANGSGESDRSTTSRLARAVVSRAGTSTCPRS